MSSNTTPLATATSYVALLLGLICLGIMAWYIPVDRRHYVMIFRDFKMELPSATFCALSIPDAAIRIGAGLIALVLILVQRFTRSKLAAAVFHMLIVVICCVVFVVYRETMLQPMSKLIEGIQSIR